MLILCATLIIFISHFNLSSSAAGVTKSSEKFDGNGDNRKFTDLNTDCLYLIFEHLELGDLVHLAQINDQFSMVAVDVYRREYSNLLVSFNNDFWFPQNTKEWLTKGMEINADTFARLDRDLLDLGNETSKVIVAKSMSQPNKQIYLQNYFSIVHTFKHFGHLIKKLNFDNRYSFHSQQDNLVGYLISAYSSKSLVDVEVSCPHELFGYISNPLINTESMSFYVCPGRDETPMIRPDELLPALRRLNLRPLRSRYVDFFYYRMPHLEHVAVDARKTGDSSSLPGIITENPQIRSLCVNGADSEFVRKVNRQLPQLETLQLAGGFSLKNGNIRFENVKKFVIESGSGYNTIPDNLYFPKLQFFHFDYQSFFQAKYLTFLSRHRHLTHLSISTNDLRSYAFEELTERLPNLVELTLERADVIGVYSFNIDATVEFLSTHHKVKKLNIINYLEERQIRLQEQLNQEWNISIIDSGLSFERK